MVKALLSNRIIAGCLAVLALFALAGIFAPWLAPHDPNEADVINAMAPSSWTYLLGTDALGRDIFSRLLYGIRTTLLYSTLTMLVTVFFGTLVGVLSGYIGGKTDSVIMRMCDVVLALPMEVIVLSVVGILGPGLTNIVFANFVAKLPWYVRMIRGATLKFRQQHYLQYSSIVGTKRSYVIRKHLLPNIASEVSILGSLDLGWIILSISALSFLGLGVQPPTAEWGVMLSEAREVLFTNPEQLLYPGIAIMIVVACCNLLGDSIRDVLDPREKSRAA
ncbi:MAG: nickel/cobalt ABC transporter permease [Pseudomonadota bacterium]